MPVPYLAGALKGWTTKRGCKTIAQTIVNHKVTETETAITAEINFQPMPPAKVNRKPEEQRTWKWWSIIIKSRTLLLSTDDIIVDAAGLRFKIQSANDWRSSGFTKYEAIEDYEVST